MAILKTVPAEGFAARFTITGDGDPSPNGYFLDGELHNGWKSYRIHQQEWYLWHDADNRWVLSTVLGDDTAGSWVSPANDPLGVYTAVPPYTGDPSIAKSLTYLLKQRGLTLEIWRVGPARWQLTPNQLRRRQARQRAAAEALRNAANDWTVLTAAQKIIWGAVANATIIVRAGHKVLATAYKRWMQVQAPLHYTGLPAEDTATPRTQTQMRNLIVKDYNVATNQCQVEWQWKRSGTGVERVTILFSQVPPAHLRDPLLPKYAKLASTKDQLIQLSDTNWHTITHWFTLLYQIEVGHHLQLYIRVIEYRNDNPPISGILSHETVEDWTDLIVEIH